MTERIVIYTDGGCRGNPGLGAWAAVFYYQNRQKTISGVSKQTTNNRMELTAAIKALASIKKPLPIVLYTDSKYVMDGILLWLPNWKKKHWRKVKNVDLWQQLDLLHQAHDVEWQWVKGHSGNTGNDLADRAVNQAMDDFLAKENID